MRAELAKAVAAECGLEAEHLLIDKREGDVEALLQVARSAEANPRHRQNALYLLGRWGDVGQVPAIVDLLSRLDDRHLKATAIQSLGRLATPSSIKAISLYAQDASYDVRFAVVNALGRSLTAEAVATLQTIQAEDQDEQVVARASRVLATRSKPR